MEKQLKDYLHFYLGCEVEYFDYIANERFVGTLSGIADENYAFVKGDQHGIPFSDIKPILRPLDDWSLRETSEYGIEMDSFRSIIALGIYEPKLFHYLLSKHFDLFDLIPAGLAIEASTINQ